MIQRGDIKKRVFGISTPQEFNDTCLEIFQFQYANNSLYRQFCDSLRVTANDVRHFSSIPFLPIEFFKNFRILSADATEELLFKSSGTGGMKRSKHYVIDAGLYHESLFTAFRIFYGNPENFTFFALLPSYLEQGDSSLVYMVKKLIERSSDPESGFYLDELKLLSENVQSVLQRQKKVLLIGVSYALLDLAEKFPMPLTDCIIMETGGMKGRRKEMVREELHQVLKKAFAVNQIHSEYGMTELLSQAYSKKDGKFYTPPWMKILVRDVNDPLSLVQEGKTGGINVIDLANIYSCSFIATQDLGRAYQDGSFEVLGRFDSSDARGCNLMVV